MEWQTARLLETDGVEVAAARAFVNAGLAASLTSSPSRADFIAQGRLVDWRRSRHPKLWGARRGAELERAERDTPGAHAFDLPLEDWNAAGLRLRAPLGMRRFNRSIPAELRRIVGHPGYQSAAQTVASQTGMASFVADFSFVPGLTAKPALSWPLKILVPDDLLPELAQAHAVTRGLASLEPWAAHVLSSDAGPRMIMHRVRFDEPVFDGDALAMRFLSHGRTLRRLPERLTFDNLQHIEPSIFFRMNGTSFADRLTDFIYALSHNHPVDVAAWDAARSDPETRRLAPLVIAPRNFLRQARLSDTIPALQSQLRQLNAESIVPLSPQSLAGFGRDLPGVQQGITVGRFTDLLDDVNRLAWDHESDTATSLIEVQRAISALKDPAKASRSARETVQHMTIRPPARAAPSGPPRPPAAQSSIPPRSPAAPPAGAAPSVTAPPPAWEDLAEPGEPGGPGEPEGASELDSEPPFAADEPMASEDDEDFLGNGSSMASPPYMEPDAGRPASENGPAEEYFDSSTAVQDSSKFETAALESALPPPVPPRYTDVVLFDSNDRALDALEPLIASNTYTLEIAVRAVRRGLAKDRDDQPRIRMPPQTDTVSVWAVISDETEGAGDMAQRLFSFDRKFAEFELPPAGDSIGSAIFKFSVLPEHIALRRPRAEDSPRIGIRLYHKLNLIDHLQLDLRFQAAPGASASNSANPGIRVIFKHPSGEEAAIEPPNRSSAARALTISISKNDPAGVDYRFAIAAGSRQRPGEPILSGTKKLSENQLNDFVARFRELLLPTVFGAALGKVALSDKDRDELLQNLSSLGDDIVTRLFDYSPGGDFFELGSMIRDSLSDMSIIQISLSEDSKDFVFPWQILTVIPSDDPDAAVDPKNLWGYRFVIEVKRRGDGVDHRAALPRPAGAARLAYARWHFTNEPAHYAALAALADRSSIPVQWITPVIERRADFINALMRGGGDLMYVYAHGHAAAPNTPLGMRYRDTANQQMRAVLQRMKSDPLTQPMTENASWVDMQEQFLKLTSADTVSSLTLSKSEMPLTSLLVAMGGNRRRLANAPIVFLNTCESAQIWNAVDGSFVGFFLDRGARAVVGTETTIPIVLADVFGREALSHLFAGESLGEAVMKARLTLLQSSRNPLGLCYCIYGAADTRLGPDPLAA